MRMRAILIVLHAFQESLISDMISMSKFSGVHQQAEGHEVCRVPVGKASPSVDRT